MNKSYTYKWIILLLLTSFCAQSVGRAQTEGKSGSHSTHPKGTISPEARALVEEAIGQVCSQAKLDPKASMAIDEMQSRPSLPVQTPEAKAGAARAQRLLPLAKTLVVAALQQLTKEYGLDRNRVLSVRIQQGIARVNAVKNVKPDMESRDNASVFLSRPHTITFGTIFLAGLRSDEGMISVLAHELMHIADGDHDSLRMLVSSIGSKAADLTGLDIRGQRSEELTCDLIGAMSVKSYIEDTPSYESISRRIARSIEHNCVDVDEGDDDHLSPRSTLRALLALNPTLVKSLVSDQL